MHSASGRRKSSTLARGGAVGLVDHLGSGRRSWVPRVLARHEGVQPLDLGPRLLERRDDLLDGDRVLAELSPSRRTMA
jgi:hypothetical protein